jgi:hypothetical protein
MKRKLVCLVLLVAAAVLVSATSASADYGKGAIYQIELSVNTPGRDGGGVWLWIALEPDFTGDYAGSDCGHGGAGTASDNHAFMTFPSFIPVGGFSQLQVAGGRPGTSP